MASPAEFQPEAVIRHFGTYDVAYVLIGGLAAVTHGSPLITQDVDICYDRSPDNLERLANALVAIDATFRGADADLPFRLDASALNAGDMFTFQTDLGWLDILGTPAGTGGYHDLMRTAIQIDLFGYRVLIASVDDLIRMKRAAGRPKDLIELENLGALREELDKSG